jgi:hypothetical protein
MRVAVTIAAVALVGVAAYLWATSSVRGTTEPKVAVAAAAAADRAPPQAPAAAAPPAATRAAPTPANVEAAPVAPAATADAPRPPPAHGAVAGDVVDPAALDAQRAALERVAERWKLEASAALERCLSQGAPPSGANAAAAQASVARAQAAKTMVPVVVQLARSPGRHAGEAEALVAEDARLPVDFGAKVDDASWTRCVALVQQLRTQIPPGSTSLPGHASIVWMVALPERVAAGGTVLPVDQPVPSVTGAAAHPPAPQP